MASKTYGVIITDKIIKDDAFFTKKYYIYNSNIAYERRILSNGTYPE